MPRFDQSFSGLCEQNLQDTLQLKQRYLDAKAKRTPKGKDKKQQDSIQSSVHVVQQKFLKRPASDEQDPASSLNTSNQQSNHDSTTANFEPPVKLQCTAAPGSAQTQNEGLTKFSVEIVQQLEFTTSAASSQPQQISTNVTVKTHANASVKSDVSSPKSKNQIGLDVGTLVECVKQEPDNDFADLDQCAAALEKDAAANGGAGCFGGFSDLIGDDTNDEIISSATFNDLISDINNYPDYELMKDFDFDEKSETTNQLKTEDTKDTNIDNKQMPNYPSPPVFMDSAPKPPNGCSRLNNAPYANVELSPAAQTLKQMAEQHHKNQMSSLTSFQQNRRSPYTDFQFQGDYGQSGGYKSQGPPAGYPQPDIVKQEMIFQGGEFDMKRKPVYKQQYSPYSSPSASSHGSPGYLPRTGTGPTNSAGQFGGGTPPRPPSGPGGNAGNGSTTVSINQAQQLNISQQSHGHTIQVSAGQHVHLSGDLKSGSVSIAAQQGMQFNQQNSNQNQQQQQSQQQQQQQPNPSPQQQQQQPVPSPMSQQHQNSPVHNSPNPNQNPLLLQQQQQQQQQQHPMDNNNAYSLSQTQTINFTQQSLRRSNNQPLPQQQQQQQQNQNQLPVMPARLVNAQTIEQQKLLQQQHFLRMQQQQQMAAAAAAQRPPPPDYKAAAMMQGGGGLQPRYGTSNTHGMSGVGGAGQVRRMPHQPMPPSGPMIRSNMYMLQQQQQQQQLQQQQRPPPQALYSRQQPGGPAAGLAPGGGLMDNTSEWRHLIMSQQQSGNFGGIRAPFQQGFNMHNQQITALQHQQMRVQQQQQQQQNVMGNQQQQQVAAAAALAQQQSQMLGQATGGNVGPNAGSPMQQMNHMNQAVLHMQQQQSLMQQQQHNQHMSLSSVHMQQSQSMTMTNASMQPQQQQQNAISGNNNNNTTSSSSLSCFNPQADFNFEFLDNLTSTDGGTTFTDQELLNSFDTDAGFNLDF